MKKITFIENLCDYWITEEGVIYRTKRTISSPANSMAQVKQVFTNKRDKNKGVFLFFKDGRKKFYYTARLVLGAYRGPRGREYDALVSNDFPRKSRTSLCRLKWELKKNLTLFNILSDNEYVAWQKKLNTLPKARRSRFNEKVLKLYLESNGDFSRNGQLKSEFFKRMFKIRNKEYLSN